MSEHAVFATLDEVKTAIQKHELTTVSTFTIYLRDKGFSCNDISQTGQRICWQDRGTDASRQIPYNGVPFIMLGREIRECQNGPDRNKRKKDMYRNQKDTKTCADHNYDSKSRCLTQPTKKMSCPARIVVKHLVRFPDYKITGIDTQYNRKKQATELKSALDHGISVQKEHEFHVSFPEENDHANHLRGEFADFCQPVDFTVKQKIKDLVGDGVSNTKEIRRHLNMFVREEVGNDQRVRFSRRFHPTDKDIRNHVQMANAKLRFSNEDQVNLRHMVLEWQKNYPDDKFFLRTCAESGSDAKFLFVHQTQWQRRLLQRYGSEMCLLDATYKTSRYSLPLFFICVNTNVGFSIVGSFLITNEDKVSIMEGLRCIYEWNRDWQPKYFMTDYDLREISAIEELFPGSFVYLCNFHREQSWERWLKTHKHGCADSKEEILKLLRAIAHSENEEEYSQHVTKLKDSSYWQNNLHLQDWFKSKWLSQKQRWVQAFRSKLLNVSVSTTNGLERQHLELKRGYLSETSDKSISSLIDILVNKFLPDSYHRYKEKNVQSLEEYRSYEADIPLFLRNRPKNFLNHCINRIPPKATPIPSENIKQSDRNMFTIKSADSGCFYEVEYKEKVPCCTCADWKRHHLPCKHMLAIFRHFPAYGWDFLPADYRNSPIFSIDPHISLSCNTAADDNLVSQVPADKEAIVTNKDQTVPSLAENVNTAGLRKECLQSLKNIECSLYGISEVDKLKDARKHLRWFQDYLQDFLKTENGLPVITDPLPRRKRAISRQKKEKRTKCPKLFETSHHPQQKEDVVEEAKEPTSCDIVETKEMKVVNKVWDVGNSFHYLLGKVGPYNILDSSIEYLKSTLSDEIIDAFLHIQSKSYLGTYHVNSVVMTAILDGNAGVHGLLQKMNISSLEKIIGAYNEGGVHWILVIILPQRKKILYLNPLGEIESAQKRILNNWYCFLERRFEGGIDNTPPGIWTISTEQHARQRDGQSCGVYVLKMAENFLSGQSIFFSLTTQQLILYRKYIGTFILSNSENINDKCRICFGLASDEDKGLMIACDKCGLYFHQKCCGKLQSFVCRLCEND